MHHSGGRHGGVEASGDDLPSGRVSRRALEFLRSEIEDDVRDGTFRGISALFLEFSRLREYIGEGEASGAKWAPHAIARRGSDLGRALLWRGTLGGPLQVPSGLHDLPDLLLTV